MSVVDECGPFYTGRQVCELAGITYRQLDYWVRTGLLKPAVDARGSGTRRQFNVDDIVRAAVIYTLDSGQWHRVDVNANPATGAYVFTPTSADWFADLTDAVEAVATASVVTLVSVDTIRAGIERGLADAAAAA